MRFTFGRSIQVKQYSNSNIWKNRKKDVKVRGETDKRKQGR
jgi:hypothetical protein